MNKIIIVTGSPGAGKSSVTGAISGNRDYAVVNVGDIMSRIGIEKGYVKHRDEMRYLTNERITELRNIASFEISQMPGKVIVDTHATIQQHGRYVPGLPGTFVKDLGNVVGLFYIDADPQAILKRRQKDATRVREEEPLNVLENQRLINIATLSTYSAHINIPLYVIFNEEGKLEASRNSFMAHLKDAFGEK